MSRPGDARSGSRLRGRLQARYSRLVRRFGGDKNPAAKKKAITAIAHTLLKIAYQVLKTGTPYQDLGADFYTRRESRQHKQAWLERQLQKLHPGCTITITISPETAMFSLYTPEEFRAPLGPPARPRGLLGLTSTSWSSSAQAAATRRSPTVRPSWPARRSTTTPPRSASGASETTGRRPGGRVQITPLCATTMAGDSD